MSESNPMAGSNSSFLKGRYSAEKRFKFYGVFAVSLALGAVIFLLFTIFSTGYSAFWRTEFQVEIQFNGDYLGITQESSDQAVREANFLGLFRKNIAEQNKDVPRRELRKLFAMFSESAADDLREKVIKNRSILGTTQKLKVLASSSVDMIVKGQAPREIEEKRRVLNDFQLGLLDRWTAEGRRSSSFNHRFFTNGDSRSPELAGLGGAIAGSFWTLMVCLILSFPMGVAAAISSLVVLLHFTANIFLASKKFDIKIILKSPSTYAVIIAVAFLYFDLEMPKFVINTVMLLGYAMIVLILMSLGVSLTQMKVFSLRSSLISSVGRVIIGPIIGFILIKIFNLSGYAAGVLLIQSAMPSAILTYLIASMYSPKETVDNISSMIVVSTLMSLITIPIIVFISLKYFS